MPGDRRTPGAGRNLVDGQPARRTPPVEVFTVRKTRPGAHSEPLFHPFQESGFSGFATDAEYGENALPVKRIGAVEPEQLDIERVDLPAATIVPVGDLDKDGKIDLIALAPQSATIYYAGDPKRATPLLLGGDASFFGAPG